MSEIEKSDFKGDSLKDLFPSLFDKNGMVITQTDGYLQKGGCFMRERLLGLGIHHLQSNLFGFNGNKTADRGAYSQPSPPLRDIGKLSECPPASDR